MLQGRIGEHESEVVGREVADIVEGMLRRTEEMLRIRGRDRGLYSDAQREDWLTDLPRCQLCC